MTEPLYIMVCAGCLRASCWYGEFFCEDAWSVGTVIKPIAELRALNREHPSYWSAEKLRKVYGHVPDFSEALPRSTAGEAA